MDSSLANKCRHCLSPTSNSETVADNLVEKFTVYITSASFVKGATISDTLMKVYTKSNGWDEMKKGLEPDDALCIRVPAESASVHALQALQYIPYPYPLCPWL